MVKAGFLANYTSCPSLAQLILIPSSTGNLSHQGIGVDHHRHVLPVARPLVVPEPETHHRLGRSLRHHKIRRGGQSDGQGRVGINARGVHHLRAAGESQYLHVA